MSVRLEMPSRGDTDIRLSQKHSINRALVRLHARIAVFLRMVVFRPGRVLIRCEISRRNSHPSQVDFGPKCYDRGFLSEDHTFSSDLSQISNLRRTVREYHDLFNIVFSRKRCQARSFLVADHKKKGIHAQNAELSFDQVRDSVGFVLIKQQVHRNSSSQGLSEALFESIEKWRMLNGESERLCIDCPAKVHCQISTLHRLQVCKVS